jgi:hypothetical protein
MGGFQNHAGYQLKVGIAVAIPKFAVPPVAPGVALVKIIVPAEVSNAPPWRVTTAFESLKIIVVEVLPNPKLTKVDALKPRMKALEAAEAPKRLVV